MNLYKLMGVLFVTIATSPLLADTCKSNIQNKEVFKKFKWAGLKPL